MYTIRDSKVEAYMNPFTVPTKGAALRMVTDIVNDRGHTFNKHPEDYILFELGEFDDNTGEIHLHQHPEVIIKLIELQKDHPQIFNNPESAV